MAHITKVKHNELTPIQEFYANGTVFVTGGTGFLGKMLILKLLTSCPYLEHIYLLVRPKRGKNVKSRIDEIFDDPIFDKMKENLPNYRDIVKGISGDCMQPGLGIQQCDRELLIAECNIIFHMAATVRFDEKLRISMQINVRASSDLLSMSREMLNLKSYMHISTAYTQCPQQELIEEKFYEPPIDSAKMLILSEFISDELMEQITPILLNKWPNTYTFTKALAEDVVKQNGIGMPVGMLRPGIVISTYRDPVCGWINNFYGPTGVIAGAGTGVLRSLRCHPDRIANMVPVDLCVNGIISAAWDVSKRFQANSKMETSQLIIENNIRNISNSHIINNKNNHRNNTNHTNNINKINNIINNNCTNINNNNNNNNVQSKITEDIPIYNYCISSENSITWGDFTTKTIKYGIMYPTIKAVWYLCYKNNPNKLLHWLSVLFLHYLPAICIDTLAIVIGKKPKLLNTYKKIHRFMNVIEYFSMREWFYQLDNINSVWIEMNDRDKEIFYFDMRKIDWDQFLEHYFRGIRQYLLKDPLDTVPEALKRWNRLYWLHQFVKAFILFVSLRVIWSVCVCGMTLYG